MGGNVHELNSDWTKFYWNGLEIKGLKFWLHIETLNRYTTASGLSVA